MAYNLTALENSQNLYDVVKFANDSTGGTLVLGMMLATFFVLLMVLKKWEFEDALLSSSFVSFILSSLLVYAELLNPMWAFGFLAITAITAFYGTVLKKVFTKN